MIAIQVSKNEETKICMKKLVSIHSAEMSSYLFIGALNLLQNIMLPITFPE